MDAISWLKSNAPGFRELRDEEVNAIINFSLMWSFFEAKALDNSANPRTIVEYSHKLTSRKDFNIDTFRPALDYFRLRYFTGGAFTDLFSRLNIRDNDNKDTIKEVIRSATNNNFKIVIAILTIVYRLRNNLFHGLKWTYQVRDQKDNFEITTALLINLLEQQA